ncbi:unnamed protein product [Fusarium equiseti]|uniref:Uncharacterized protein n=1 Tax=Fusarium equiseti TaxID=61235 RepID=A0A8J2IQD4_FUSEQ|nr:unnamed protein product [Fusarium equiseti]
MPNSRTFEIARGRDDDPDVNIMTQIHGLNDGWTGVIDNEDSLMNVYHLIPREEVTFFFAAKFPRESGTTQVPVNPGLIQFFNPVSRTNAIPSGEEPLRNAWCWVRGWNGVFCGTIDSYEGLVEVFRKVPTSVVSFIIAGNRSATSAFAMVHRTLQQLRAQTI